MLVMGCASIEQGLYVFGSLKIGVLVRAVGPGITLDDNVF